MLDRTRIVVNSILSLSLFTLTAAAVYLAFEINWLNGQMPAVINGIDAIAVEVKKIREEAPEILDRADSIVANANQFGKKVGQGSVDGFITGVIGSPITIAKEFGKSFESLLKEEGVQGIKKQDIKIMKEKTKKLLRLDHIGDDIQWKNEKTENHGIITLLGHNLALGINCRQLKYESWIHGKPVKPMRLSVCKKSDGHWGLEKNMGKGTKNDK